jgi:hypothetical protein
MRQIHFSVTLIAFLLLNACASFNTPDPSPWNIKEIKTTTYESRIQRSKAFQDLKAYLDRKGLQLEILDQDSDITRGSLASLYADGLYFNFTDDDTARHVRERTENLMATVLDNEHGPSEWVVGYCIDFTNSSPSVDLGFIKADLYYSLTHMTAAHFGARPHNLESCQQDPGVKPLYRQKVVLTATFDGAKTDYVVLNPAKPLKDIERFDLTLTDLTYQAAETILTDRGLVDAVMKETETLPNRSKSIAGINPEAICRQIKLDPASTAFKECVAKLSGH